MNLYLRNILLIPYIPYTRVMGVKVRQDLLRVMGVRVWQDILMGMWVSCETRPTVKLDPPGRESQPITPTAHAQCGKF